MTSLTRALPLFAAAALALSACAVAPPTEPADPGQETSAETTGAETTGTTQEPDTPSTAPESPESPGQPTSEAPAGQAVNCDYPASGEPAKPVDPPNGTNVAATGEVNFSVETNEGTLTLTMDRAKAPCTVNSFESLATQGYFDQTSCHRLVDSGIFVLQCGDPSGTGMGGPGYTFADETDPSDTFPAGTVAMANAGPDTNGSQFFLVYEDTELPPNYTVFGTMDAESTGIVARIAVEGQDGTSPGGGGKPNNPAEIVRVTAG